MVWVGSVTIQKSTKPLLHERSGKKLAIARNAPVSGDTKQWVAIVAVVFRGDRLLAMQRTSTNEAGAGIWEAISGRVAALEEPLDAAVREIQEESGLSAVVHPHPVDSYATRRGEEPMTVIVYRAESVSGEVERSSEHSAHRWCTVDEFAELGAPRRLVQAARHAYLSRAR